MMYRKTWIAAIAMAFALNAAAQTFDNEGIRPFISVQGGVTRSFLQEGVDRKWVPMGAISFGAYFTPAIGARVQANGWAWNQNNPIVGKRFKNAYYGGDVDLLLNLCNIVNPHYDKPVNIVLLGGFGLHYAKTTFDNVTSPLLDKKHERLAPNLRAGGQLDVALSRSISVLAEGGVQMVSDDYGNSGTRSKAWPYALVGLSYKFGKKKKNVAPASTAYLMETDDNQNANTTAAQPVVAEKQAEKPAPAPVVEPAKPAPAKTTQTVNFKLGSAQLDAQQQAVVNEVATWAKNHPEATITLTGYADKGTGNAQINQRISEQRAAAVKQELVKRGIPATRISTDAKGDSIQPFKNNDENRAVIVIAEEK